MLLPLLCGLACAMLICAWLVSRVIQLRVMDVPVARSSHTAPTPKGGGIGILITTFVFAWPFAWAAGLDLLSPDGLVFGGILLGAGILGMVSWLDDIHSYPARLKLAAQTLATCLAIAGPAVMIAGWQSAPLIFALGFLWVMLCTNALNFIDGLNGLCAGSMALASLILGGLALCHKPDGLAEALALLLIILGGCLIAFLPFNFPKARIFMGDVGSQSAGLILSAAGPLLAIAGAVPWFLPFGLLFGILFDVLFTLIRRFFTRQRLMQAHRSHLYQLAVRSGIPSTYVALLHWGFVLWGAGVVMVSSSLTESLAALLLPQILWCAAVCALARSRVSDAW